MKTRTQYVIIFLTCLLIFLVASTGLSRAEGNKDMTMQEMTQRFEAMEKRLSELEDIEAIKRLQIEYAYCLHKGNFDTIEYLFTQDAVAFGNVKGREAIGNDFRTRVGQVHKGKDGVILSQPIIDLDGDKAKGEWAIYFFYSHPETYQLMSFFQGFFKNEYRKVNGKWLISSLVVEHHISPPGGAPTDEWKLNFLDQAQKTMQEMHD